MPELQGETSDLEKRSAQLAAMPPQQLLGYIAALMEVLLRAQTSNSKVVLEALAQGIKITGEVKVDDVLPLKVEVENAYPIKVEIENDPLEPVTVVVKEIEQEVKVEVSNLPISVEVSNTPLEVTTD